MAEGLSRAETVRAVRNVVNRSPKVASGKGRGGAKPRKVTERVIRTEAGVRVTLECKKGLDREAVLAALREATAQVEAEPGNDQVAA